MLALFCKGNANVISIIFMFCFGLGVQKSL